jgi:hypothetical protein
MVPGWMTNGLWVAEVRLKVSSTKWIPLSLKFTTFWVQKNPWSDPGMDMFVATVLSWIPNS